MAAMVRSSLVLLFWRPTPFYPSICVFYLKIGSFLPDYLSTVCYFNIREDGVCELPLDLIGASVDEN